MDDVEVDHRLTFLEDTAPADWIATRLGPFGSVVGSVVPRGFAAYARVLHPVQGPPGGPRRWAQVCAATGRTPHALMQWESVARPADPVEGPAGPGVEAPRLGQLDHETLARLLAVLEEHSTPGGSCVLALWEGHGWIHGGRSVGVLLEPGARPGPDMPPAFGPEVVGGARLHLPHRDYLLFSGPLGAVETLGWSPTPDTFSGEAPNLVWPTERSWCMATEVDLDSTLVGGSTELITAVLADAVLEAWPVDVDDDLGLFADTINT